MDKDGVLAEIRATHDPLAAAAGEVPDAAWHAAVADMDGWTRKDVLAHVGWWSDHSARVIAALTAGEVPYDRDEAIDINAQNASIREQFLDRDPVEVRAFESAAFERLVAAVEGTSEEDLFAVGRYPWLEEQTLAAAVEWDSTKHFPEHVPHLAGPREPADALETVALSAIAIPHIGSAVVFVLPEDGSALVLAAAAGIEGPPPDRLKNRARQPGA